MLRITLLSVCLVVLFFKGGDCQTNVEIDNLYNEAVRYYQDGKYEQSKQLFIKASEVLCSDSIAVEKCIDLKTYLSDIERTNRNFESSETFLNEAEQILKEKLETPHPLQIEIYLQKVFLYVDMTNFEDAESAVNEAMELAEDQRMQGLPRARAFLASAHLDDVFGNFSQSLESYSKAVQAIEHLDREREVLRFLAMAYNNMGIVTRRIGNVQQAMGYFQDALEVTKSLYGDDHPEVGMLYNSIGTIHYISGDFGQAADYFLRTGEIYKKNYGENHERVAGAYNNAGISYLYLNDIKKATDNLEEAQRIKEDLLGKRHIDTAIGYSNLAAIYMDNENYDAALKNYQLSISVREEIHGPDHPSLVAAYISLGNFYVTTEKYTLARDHYVEAERIIELRLGESHPDNWEVNNKIALSYQEEKQYDKAISYYQKALHLMSENGISTKETYDFNSISYPYTFLATLSGIGESTLKEYQETGRVSALEDAYYFLMWSADLIEKLQTEYQNEASKLNLIDQNYSIYTHAIETSSYLYNETSDEKWLEEIFRLSEMSRSRIALELLQELQARSFAGVPENILEKEREINTDITGYYQHLHAELVKGFEADEGIISAYRDSLFNSRRALNNFTDQLESEYPEYYRLKYDRSFVSRSDVANLLSAEETYVNYVVSEEQVYALVLDSEEISFHSLGSPDSLAAQVQSFREAVATDKRTEYSELAHHLYQKLLEPLLPAVNSNSLIIAPDQMLHYLPFEMLLTKKAETADYYKMPYLIREMKVSYVPSATVFQMLDEQKISNPRNLFAAAPFNETTVQVNEQTGASRYLSDLSPLPLTRYEISTIAEVFQEQRSFWDYFSPEKADIFLGEDASKSTIKNTSFEEYGFIHFATHAFVNEEDPALSGIAFWGDGDDEGIIYVNDIYNMNMKADLVVLGACETGLGTVYKGEGMIGFARAFFYAGASNLLVSMWKVNDQPTANLMIQFYKYVKEGHPYSESLQLAKMELIDQPEFAAPRHWAAFVLQGR